MFEASHKILDDILIPLNVGLGGRDLRRSLVDSAEQVQSQLRGWSAVEFGDLVEDFDGLCFSASAQEEFGRLVESEHEEPEEEDSESHETKHDDFVAPSHVRRNFATSFAISNGVARGQSRIASPFRSCSVCDGRGHDNTDGLP